MKLAKLYARPGSEPVRTVNGIDIYAFDPDAEIEFLHYGAHPLMTERGTLNSRPRGTFVGDWTEYLGRKISVIALMEVPAEMLP